jgi:hypothetical protein
MPPALSLNFRDSVRIAGETIHGTVNIHTAAAQKDSIEHIKVYFRGLIKT